MHDENEDERIVDDYPRPRGIWVRRGSKEIWLEMDPQHPRYSMSMGPELKRLLSVEDRYNLAERLADHVHEALSHWPDEPVCVHVRDMDLRVKLSDNPHAPGKMLVRL